MKLYPRTILICTISVALIGCNHQPQGTGTRPTANSLDATSTEHAPKTDIFAASGDGNLEAVRRHIAAGADINAAEPAAGGTPLIVATVTGQIEVVRFLIENGASLTVANNDGATALHTAAFFAHPEVVRLLIDHGAEVNAKNIRGETPLDTVAAEWNGELQAFYHMLAVAFRLELDFHRIRSARPVVAELLRQSGGKTGTDLGS